MARIIVNLKGSGIVLRDPRSRLIVTDGQEVADSLFWRRRVLGGEITISDVCAKPAPVIAKAVDKKEKN